MTKNEGGTILCDNLSCEEAGQGMPSKTFFHLPAEKREQLLLAAEEEFARVPLC